FESEVPNVGGMTFFGKPGSMYALGSVIEARTNASSGCLARAASAGSLSRSGPTLPAAFAAVSVWHAAQPLLAKTAAPAVPLLGDEMAAASVVSHFVNAAGVTTRVCVRMSA